MRIAFAWDRPWWRSAGKWALCAGVFLGAGCRSAAVRDEPAYPKYRIAGWDPNPGSSNHPPRTAPAELAPNPVTPPRRRIDTAAIGIPQPPDDDRAEDPAAAFKANQRIVARYAHSPGAIFHPEAPARRWQYIVLHHSGTEVGGLASIDRYHREVRGWDGCGYHFVIGNGSETGDGEIEASSRWLRQKYGAHCRDIRHPEFNREGIGICLVGNFDRGVPSPRQVEAAHALVEYLQARYRIPADHVNTHSAFVRERTQCPGRQFPRDEIIGPPLYSNFKVRQAGARGGTGPP